MILFWIWMASAIVSYIGYELSDPGEATSDGSGSGFLICFIPVFNTFYGLWVLFLGLIIIKNRLTGRD